MREARKREARMKQRLSELSAGGISVRIGISACLLGQRVRYDGDHKRHDWLTDELGPQVTWVPVCPEVEVGMGVPREPIVLIDDGRLLGVETGRDSTAAMQEYAAERVARLHDENLSGYVFKSKSPSCGIASVKVYTGASETEPVATNGRGLFAAALMARYPDLPVAEERDLDDPARRSAFVEQVVNYRKQGRNS